MKRPTCPSCRKTYPADAFRLRAKGVCVWCEWACPEKRARARYRDKQSQDRERESYAASKGKKFIRHLRISEEKFVAWYLSEPDQCHYCGLKLSHLRELQLKRGAFGYSVSWDIDRKDPSRFYEAGNLALSCFMCNMAKASYFTEVEAKVIGKAVRNVVRTRLKAARNAA